MVHCLVPSCQKGDLPQRTLLESKTALMSAIVCIAATNDESGLSHTLVQLRHKPQDSVEPQDSVQPQVCCAQD